MHKDVFLNGHKQFNIIKDCINLSRKIEELKPYIIEFDKNNAIKPKIYPFYYAIRKENQRPIIVITHNKCTFSANDRVYKV